MTLLHHAAVCVGDLDTSLRFYREGVGLTVLADSTMEADLDALLGVSTTSFRTIFLGAAGHLDSGIIELLELGNSGIAHDELQAGIPTRGVFLLSLQVEVDAVLARLADMGLGGTPRRMPTPSGEAATVVDPDGVMVELLPLGPLSVLQPER